MTAHPVVKLTEQLMRIPSVSEDEEKVGRFLAEHLQQLGYTTELIPVSPGSNRYNVYAYLGSRREARTCLTSHMDTVPPHVDFRMDGEIIYGRGACDDKGPIAAQIVALEELRAAGRIKNGDASLLFVVGEEKGGPGMLAVNDMRLKWEAIIFGEPTEGKLATGHKGHYVFELLAKGSAAHSGYPSQGRSANTTMVSALEELAGLQYPESDQLGPSTFHCGRIEGGVAYNVLAAESYALCGVRVASELALIQEKVRSIVARYPDITLKDKFAYSETYLDHDVEGGRPLASTLQRNRY
jgi:acetylornithine deacetylase